MLVASKLSRMKNDPQSFTNWLQELFLPDDADKIIDAIRDNRFDKNFGTKMIDTSSDLLEEVSFNGVPQSDENSESNFKARITDKIGNFAYENWIREFTRRIIELSVFNIRTGASFNPNEIIEGNITSLNYNILNFKNELLDIIAQVTKGSYKLNINDSDETITKTIDRALSDFRSIPDNFSNMQAYKAYMFLDEFDSFITKTIKCVKLKGKYANSNEKGVDMYDWIGPTINLDGSWLNDETADINKYSSKLIKLLCDYIPEVKIDEDRKILLDAPLGFKEFNAAASRVISWATGWGNESAPEEIRHEIRKGEKCDWRKIINAYKETFGVNDIFGRKLNALSEIVFGTNENGQNYLSKELRDAFTYQMNNMARTTWLVYRISRSDGVTMLESESLKDNFYNKQNVDIRNNIRSQIYYFGKQQKMFNDICETYKIKIDQNTITFVGADPEADNNNNKTAIFSKDFVVGINFNDILQKYTFDVNEKYDGEIYNSVLQSLAMELGIMSYFPDNYKDIINSSEAIKGRSLLDILLAPIAVTLIGSKLNENNGHMFLHFPDAGVKKNANGGQQTTGLFNLWQYKRDFDDLATFVGVLQGSEELSVSKNAKGNNLPNNQLKATINDAKNIIEDNINLSLNKIRSGIHNESRSSIFKDYDINKNPGIITGVSTRSDLMLNGNIKDPSQYSSDEVAGLSMVQDFFLNLIKGNNVNLQTITHADKKTHFLIEYALNRVMIGDLNLAESLKIISGLSNENYRIADVKKSLYDYIRKINANRTYNQIKEMTNRYFRVINMLASIDDDKNPFYKYQTELIKREIAIYPIDDNQTFEYDAASRNMKMIDKFINMFESVEDLRRAFILSGVDCIDDYDFIEWKNGLHANETIYNALELYCNPNDSYYGAYCASCQNYDIQKLMDSGFAFSVDRDPSIRYIKKKLIGSHWFNNTSGDMDLIHVLKDMKPVRIGLDNMNELIPTDISKITGEYDVELNPIYEAYYIADRILNQQFNDNIYGVVSGFEIKSAKNRNFDINFDDLNSNDIEKRNKARAFLKECEAERSLMQGKRTVIGGATRFSFNFGGKNTVSDIIKVAIKDDTKALSSNLSGSQSSEKIHDGSGWSSPIEAKLECNSSKDLAVGRDKKTIIGWNDPETGALQELKWAVFEITNKSRRDSGVDRSIDFETAFRKMHNLRIDPETLKNLNLSEYYDPDGKTKGEYIINERIYKYDNDSGKNYALDKIEKVGNNEYLAYWYESNENGVFDDESNPIIDRKVLTSLYDIDQFIGGAWTKTYDANADKITYKDINVDLLTNIVCDMDLKDKFIAYLVNKSASKVAARNVNSTNCCNIDNKDDLNYFEMSLRYGGIQMNADHDLDESTVTEMSQVISALIQRGNCFNMVKMMYEDIGRVALEAIDKIKAANESDNNNDIFEAIGHALIDTFNAGNKNTIGLTQAFVSRFEQLLKSGKKNIKFTLPLSAETITPAFFATVGAMLNKRGIKRKYAGLGGYQCPSYNVMRHYNYSGSNMNYEEICNIVRAEMNKPGSKLTSIQQAFTDAMIVRDDDNGIFFDRSKVNIPEKLIPYYKMWLLRQKGMTGTLDGDGRYLLAQSYEITTTKGETKTVLVGSDEDLTYFNEALKNHPDLLNPTWKSDNPFVKKINNRNELKQLWIEDTVVIVDRATGKIIATKKLQDEDDLDNIKNYTDFSKYNIFNWTIRPKELISGKTDFTIAINDNGTIINRTFTLHDLESIRASRYLSILADKGALQQITKDGWDVKDKMALVKRQIKRLGIIKRVENGKQLGFIEEEKLNEILNNPIKNKKSIQSLQKAIVDLSRKDLNRLSRIKHGENISIPIQDSFFEGLNISDPEKNIKVIDVKKTAGQIVIGLKNKKQYLLQRGDTLNSMKNHKGGFAGFFEERLLKKYRPIDEVLSTGELSKINKDRDIAIAYNKDGNLMVFVKSSNITDGITENSDYTRDSNGTVWYKGEEELGEINGAKFYKIKDTKIDFVVVGNNDSIEDSIKEFKKSGFIEYDQISTGKGDEDLDAQEKYKAMIKRKAAQMAKSFIVQLNYIGARIPAQSMQSFMDLEVIDFIDSDINQVYVPRQLTWFQGSDFDIDKLYLLGFEVDNFGMVYTQTDLYKYSEKFNFDYKDLLLLPMATGKDWEYLRKNGNNINQVDITGLIDKYNRNYYKVIKEILDNPNKYRNGFYTSDVNSNNHKNFVKNLYMLLNVHDSTKLEGSRKTGALKNVVAAKMLEVCKDASTQIDAHLPIEMDEARAAAAKNDGDAKVMTWNSSIMKFELQHQNMIGRTVIATVAVSLKSYFASLHSFQNRVAELQNALKEKNLNIDVNTYDAINFINQLLDITFAGKNGEILTLTNIDFDELKRELLNVLGDKENKIKIIKNGLNNKKGSGSENLDKYITNNPEDDSEAYFDIYRFVDDLDKASNKNYLTENNSGDLIWNGLDAALSLSGLLSAATDNAKELILVKLNATSEFADIYSAGLTTGMSFWKIADIMTSKAFNIVKKFSSQKIFDKNTKHFNIRNAINFVADKEDLNCLQKGVLDRLLISKDILRLIFKEGSENGNFRQEPLVDFSGLIEGDGLLQAFNNTEKEYLYSELSDNNIDEKYNDFIRNRILRELRYGDNAIVLNNLIMNYLENKIKTDAFKKAEDDDIASNFWFDEDEFEDDSFNSDLDDSYFEQSYNTRKSIKDRVLTSNDYLDLYKYFKFYLNPKNEALRAIGKPTEVDNEINNIRSIFRLLDIADEMKINGRLCGINQGVKNNNIDEENFVEDINRFINKKYYDYVPAPGEKVDFIPFDLIRFTSNDDEYREQQIDQYEKVKASINILKSVTSVGHFNAMLKFINLNRSLITKATSMNFARHLATEALKDGQKGKNTRNGIPYYMTKKFSANAFKTISRFSRDTLIINWLNSMSDSDAAFVAPKGEAMYNNKFQLVTAGKDYNLSLKTRQGILTFKRLMDYYIIPRLKKALGVTYINEDSSETRANEFLSRMKLYTYIDSKTNSIKSYTALDTRITNIEDNAALLKVYDNIVNDFKDIMNLTIGKINEGISNDDDKINFGNNWTIKDLFFMYNLIQNKDGFGRNSYTRIFEDLVSSGRQIDRINRYYEWLSNRDMQNGNYSGINYNIQNLRFQIALNNSDDAWKVNAQTGTSENGDSYIEMDGQRYTPKSHIPIDDTFDTIMDYFVVASKQNVEGFFDSRINVVPKETMVPQTIMEILQTKFGANAKVEFFKPSPGSRYHGVDGYVDSNGVIHINSKYEGAGDVSRIMLHEYMHVICAALKFNSNTKDAYYELLNKIREKINNKENREKWLSKLIEIYTRMGVYGSALYEEILIKSIESAYKNSEVYEKLNKEGIKIPDIKNILMELFNLNPENVEKENATAIKLANTSVQNVLELFSANAKSLGIRPGADWSQTVRMNAELIWLKKKVIDRFKTEAKKGDIEFIGC